MTLDSESIVEDVAQCWSGEHAIGHRPHIAPAELTAERDSFGDVVLAVRSREATWRLYPAIAEGTCPTA